MRRRRRQARCGRISNFELQLADLKGGTVPLKLQGSLLFYTFSLTFFGEVLSFSARFFISPTTKKGLAAHPSRACEIRKKLKICVVFREREGFAELCSSLPPSTASDHLPPHLLSTTASKHAFDANCYCICHYGLALCADLMHG
jgi:hypothetical protein